MQPLISVIVPVYKVEAYLDQCMQSIVNQTYRNIEVILVDDGSPDNSPAMCDTWANRDNRVKVIHKINGGASDSRNVGMDSCDGDYIIFIDSDDVVSENIVEALLQGCLQNNVKLSMCPLQNFSGAEPSLKKEIVQSEILQGKFICKHFFDYYASGPVAKLFHKSIVQNHRFIIGRKVGEDAAFNYPIFYSQDKVCFVYKAMYFYRANLNSATGTYNLGMLDELDTFSEMLEFYKERKETKILQSMTIEYFARLLAHQNKIRKQKPDEVEVLQSIHDKIDFVIKNNNLSCIYKLFLQISAKQSKVFLKLFFKVQSKEQQKLKR